MIGGRSYFKIGGPNLQNDKNMGTKIAIKPKISIQRIDLC
jgi:hypothetical protein